MNDKTSAAGLDSDTRSRLLSRLSRRASGTGSTTGTPPPPLPRPPVLGSTDRHEEIRLMREAAKLMQIEDPFFQVHTAAAGATTQIDGASLHNFSSYNYLGLNGDPRVIQAAKDAIDRYGTSVSASRIVSGERPLHQALERRLADVYSAEDAVAMVSGHATNVTVIGCLVGAGDLIVHDSFSHNSVVQGALLSGAHRVSFPHNDLLALERVLATVRPRFKQALVIVEGHYSMDGDVPDLAGLIPIVRRHRASLMVDEAHSLGVLGARGFGIAEHAGVDPSEVDVWMGTLSKTLAGCGGYVAGRRELVEFLKFTAPGFVYSVGMSPPVAAAALSALEIMHAEPGRVAKLAENGQCFLQAAKRAGLDTGSSIGSAITPIIIGSSVRAVRISHRLFQRGINVQPIIHPAVPERLARLRFFLSSEHEPSAIETCVAIVAEEVERAKSEQLSLAGLRMRLALQ